MGKMKALYTTGRERRQSIADGTQPPSFEELWEMQERYLSCLRLARQHASLPPSDDRDAPF